MCGPSRHFATTQHFGLTYYLIPIVFTQVADPVGFGLVQSVGHPGGNVTGFVVWELSNDAADLAEVFAGKASMKGADRFTKHAWTKLVTLPVPRL